MLLNMIDERLALTNRGAFSLFAWSHLFTPIAIDLIKYSENLQSVGWKSLYVFGFRVARWRTETEI